MSVIRVRVVGEDKVRRALETIKFRASHLEAAWRRIGAKVKRDATPLTPFLSGALANTIRASKGKSSAVVRAGNKRIVYAGVQHYGGYNNIEAKPFLTTALHANEDYAEREISKELDRIIESVGLT